MSRSLSPRASVRTRRCSGVSSRRQPYRNCGRRHATWNGVAASSLGYGGPGRSALHNQCQLTAAVPVRLTGPLAPPANLTVLLSNTCNCRRRSWGASHYPRVCCR